MLDPVAPAAQHLRGVARVEGHAREHDVADRVGVELELGDDAEVRARAAQRPQQVLVGVHDAAVREHDLRARDVVDRQPVLAGHEADAARGREPADADVAVVARAHPEPVLAELLRDVAPARARAEPRHVAVDADAVELAEVDHDAAVVRRAAADAVPAAAHGQRHVLLARVDQRL